MSSPLNGCQHQRRDSLQMHGISLCSVAGLGRGEGGGTEYKTPAIILLLSFTAFSFPEVYVNDTNDTERKETTPEGHADRSSVA